MGDDYDNIPRLTSIRSYNQLDNIFLSKGDYKKCSEFDTNPTDHSKPHLLCLSLTGNLQNYEKLNFFEQLNSYKCNYLNLWAYYRYSKFDKTEHPNIRGLIIERWKESGKLQVCDNTPFVLYLSSEDDYIKAKRLYDYALNYYKLKERHDDYDIPCTSKQKEYIRISIELYKSIKKECEDSKNKHRTHCKAYEVVKEIHPDDKLLNLQCKKVEDESLFSRGPHNRPGQMDALQRQQQQVVRDQEGGLGHDSHEVTESSSYGLHSPSGSHQAMVTAVPILGISSIFFLLYKFTGLGSMARNLLRTKGINGMNSHEGMTHELLENTYDDNAYPDITETYIGYQAT
ncbi:PIR Superfamily Protein [Plasmodium ovale wallikeri]|uniref:PIR Superfamily Protein n=1 Tax=Plasmodium ovale wallikeri TaxID=864142 RepID=A0A1A9AI48_PLAOA|nr:PIR Superfamily Protein [Plasmodium ovale wallikeri]